MINTIKETPKIYSNFSRDYQLISKLFDAAFNITKTASDTMLNLQGTEHIDKNFIELLSTTQGFKYTNTYNMHNLLRIVENLRYLISNKGSKKSIEDAFNVIINAQGAKMKPIYKWETDIDPSSEEPSKLKNKFEVYVLRNIKDTNLMYDLFEYILPAGWVVSICKKDILEQEIVTIIGSKDSIRIKKDQTTSLLPEMTNISYLSDNTKFSDIGAVPIDNSNKIVSPAVNINTVYNAAFKNQEVKKIKGTKQTKKKGDE